MIDREYQAPFSAYRPDGDGKSRDIMSYLGGTGYGEGEGNAVNSHDGEGISDDTSAYEYNERHGIYGSFWGETDGNDE